MHISDIIISLLGFHTLGVVIWFFVLAFWEDAFQHHKTIEQAIAEAVLWEIRVIILFFRALLYVCSNDKRWLE